MAYAGKNFGGLKVMAGLVGGPGIRAPPPDAGKFSKNLQKNFKGKWQKMNYFSIFFKKLTNHALIFCAYGRKTQRFGRF